MERMATDMYEVFKEMLDTIGNWGEITKCSMSETYSSIDINIGGEKYMMTIMKEENKDAE